MKFIFRADANKNIGIGHAMRCMSLADALKKNGCECIFVVSDDSFSNKIAERGFECQILQTDYSDTEGEIPKLKEVLLNENADWLIVDTYFATDEYFKELKKIVKTAYFDDVYSFPYDVDVLINYNIYASKEDYESLYKGNNLPRLILGPKYAPLRKEFAEGKIKEQKEKAEYVLVSVGGSDPFCMAKAFVKTIDETEELKNNLKFRFVLSNMEPDIAELKEFSQNVSWLEVHENVKDMKGIIDLSDMALSAAGSTQYELCACGVPTINFAFADNQLPGGEKFGKEGIFMYAGDVRDEKDFYPKVAEMLRTLYSDKEKRTMMAQKAYSLIDGRGAERLAKEFLDE